METLTIQQRTITITDYKFLPRKKKKKLKNAMKLEWHEEPLDMASFIEKCKA